MSFRFTGVFSLLLYALVLIPISKEKEYKIEVIASSITSAKTRGIKTAEFSSILIDIEGTTDWISFSVVKQIQKGDLINVKAKESVLPGCFLIRIN